MGEDRQLTISIPAPPGWPEGTPWAAETDVLAHEDGDGTLYIAPLGSPPFPGPAAPDPITGAEVRPVWIDHSAHTELLDARRAWDAAT